MISREGKGKAWPVPVVGFGGTVLVVQQCLIYTPAKWDATPLLHVISTKMIFFSCFTEIEKRTNKLALRIYQ